MKNSYEYKYFYDNAEILINQRNKEGWNLVAFDHNGGRALYKRPTQHQPDAVKVPKRKGKSPSRKAGRAQ